MGDIKTAADAAWRDYKIIGVASSGAHEPVKGDIRAVMDKIDTAIANTVANASYVFETRAAMDASLGYPENTMGQVTSGIDAGIYRKTGVSGSGAWIKTGAPTTTQVLEGLTSAERTATPGAIAALDPGVAGGLVGPNMGRVLTVDEFGRHVASDEHRQSVAWIDGGRACATDEYGRDVIVTDATPAALAARGLANGRMVVRRDFAAFGAKMIGIHGAVAGSAPVHAGGVVLHLPIFGDSISNGSRATESYAQVGDDAFGANVWMIKRVTGGGGGAGIDDVRVGQDNSSTGVIAPLTSASLEGLTQLVERVGVAANNGQSWASGFARALQVAAKRDVGLPHRLVFSAHGVGGAVYSDIAKGTTPYANMLVAVTHVATVAAAWGERAFVPAVLISVGTNDVALLTESDLNQFWTDVNADIKAITGQVADIVMILHQPSPFYDATSQIAPFNILAAARANPSRFAVANPQFPFHVLYPNTINDLIHLSGRASRYQGEYMARVFAARALLGKSVAPFAPTSVVGAGASTLMVTMAVPTAPVVIDTTTIAAVPGMGFRVRNAANALVAVTAATITGQDEIQLTLASPADASGAVLEYGAGGHILANGRASATIPRGNVRDSDPTLSVFDATPLPNWALHSKTAIAGDIAPETAAALARMTVAPSVDRRAALDRLVRRLIKGGVWSKLDALYLLAAHDAQAARLNLIADAYALTEIGGLTFTTDRGYQGDGATGYLNTGFNPTTAISPRFARDDAHMGLWSLTDGVYAAHDMGAGNSSLAMLATAGNFQTRGNSGLASGANASGGTGHLMWSRSDATQVLRFRNGAAASTTTVASLAPSNYPFRICGYVTTTASYSARQIGAAHWGRALTATEVGALYAALRLYILDAGIAA